jgi:hypothetical protein
MSVSAGQVRYTFEDGVGRAAQGWEAIAPLMTVGPDRIVKCVGTAFFIHVSGILVTAAHVIPTQHGNVVDGMFVLQWQPPDMCVARNVFSATKHSRHDVAILQSEVIVEKTSNTPLKNKILNLTSRIPQEGSEIATWAFPNAVHTFDGHNGSVEVRCKGYVGELRSEFRDGRDSVVLPGSCYETTLAIEAGASGGPVFDSDGYVFAVNSTGIDGTDIGYVSHIQRIGGLPVRNYRDHDGTIKNIEISKLAEMGEISIDRQRRQFA